MNSTLQLLFSHFLMTYKFIQDLGDNWIKSVLQQKIMNQVIIIQLFIKTLIHTITPCITQCRSCLISYSCFLSFSCRKSSSSSVSHSSQLSCQQSLVSLSVSSSLELLKSFNLPVRPLSSLCPSPRHEQLARSTSVLIGILALMHGVSALVILIAFIFHTNQYQIYWYFHVVHTSQILAVDPGF